MKFSEYVQIRNQMIAEGLVGKFRRGATAAALGTLLGGGSAAAQPNYSLPPNQDTPAPLKRYSSLADRHKYSQMSNKDKVSAITGNLNAGFSAGDKSTKIADALGEIYSRADLLGRQRAVEVNKYIAHSIISGHVDMEEAKRYLAKLSQQNTEVQDEVYFKILKLTRQEAFVLPQF